MLIPYAPPEPNHLEQKSMRKTSKIAHERSVAVSDLEEQIFGKDAPGQLLGREVGDVLHTHIRPKAWEISRGQEKEFAETIETYKE